MHELTKDNKNQFKSIFFIIKILALFIFTIPSMDYWLGASYSRGEILSSLLFIFMTLSGISLLWIMADKKKSEYGILAVIEVVVFFVMCISAVWYSGGIESDYKFIFIFMVVLYTIEYGRKPGLVIAVISSVMLLAMDLITYNNIDQPVNSYFETDLVLSGVFVIIAWILGFYVDFASKQISTLRDDINVDGLTGAYNHRYFYEVIIGLCEENASVGDKLSLLMLDIDNFKMYNDMFGHQKGDEILIDTTALIRKMLKPEDMLFRYGGDEFSVIMKGCDVEEATSFANELRDKVASSDFYGKEHLPKGRLTLSVGVAEYIPGTDRNYKSFISRADSALYRAKFLKRDSVEVYASIFEELGALDDASDHVTEKINSLKTLITVINSRDSYTFNHVERVVYLCKEFADYLKLPTNEKRSLIYGAYLHDIGKINIKKEILISDKSLTEEEWEEMKTHPVYSADIISGIEGFSEFIPIVRQHHEHYDGKGYPDNLKGEDIPYLARILTIVDSYDAMTSFRPYSPKKNKEQAIAEIRRCSGTHFDPILSEEFIKMIENQPANKANKPALKKKAVRIG